MRIIAGRLRRQTLRAPKGHLTRPTSERTREALFSLVQARIALDDADVLDLFAGTGALGFEALSRGAAAVTFVESESAVLRFTRRNAEDLGVTDQCVFLRSDAVEFVSRYGGPPFDLILADPPYDLEGLTRLPDLALPHVRPGGLFILEHDKRHEFSEHPALDTSRPYGRTTVSVFWKPESDGSADGDDEPSA